MLWLAMSSVVLGVALVFLAFSMVWRLQTNVSRALSIVGRWLAKRIWNVVLDGLIWLLVAAVISLAAEWGGLQKLTLVITSMIGPRS
jgi:hypothetical protein